MSGPSTIVRGMTDAAYVILGFDARERWVAREALFPPTRDDTYLLRPETRKPLSVDVLVWPTVFANPDVAGLALPGLGDDGLPRPAFVGPVQGLWTGLALVERALAARGASLPGSVSVVAVTLPVDRVDVFGPERIPKVAPAQLSPAWRLLGYDVADRFLLSGLMNCGYDAHEVPRLRAVWSQALNSAGLFDDEGAAAKFAAERDAEVAEHAPFLPFGLWERKAYAGSAP